jgi:hypothetical protein
MLSPIIAGALFGTRTLAMINKHCVSAFTAASAAVQVPW